MRVEHFEHATLYLGDCQEIVPTLDRPAALISDPPYGQKLNANILYRGEGGNGLRKKRVMQRSGRFTELESTTWPTTIEGDDKPFDPAWLLERADTVLLWGHHKFGHRLPAGTVLVWDKVPTGKVRNQGDGETAWVNDRKPRPLRIFRLLWDGFCVGAGARHEVTAGQKRIHPTQKPEILMRWSLEQCQLAAGATILDPYMGTGSTGVAALQLGHPFVGIEKVERYFDTACRRIAAARPLDLAA